MTAGILGTGPPRIWGRLVTAAAVAMVGVLLLSTPASPLGFTSRDRSLAQPPASRQGFPELPAALPAMIHSAAGGTGQWVNVTAGVSVQPSPRSYAAVAWDAKDQEYLLFGGESNGVILNDTWVYRAGAWAHLRTSPTPPARYGAGLVFDPVDNYTVLFGGNGSSGPVPGTWEFVGGTWTHLIPVTPYASRSFPAMAFDPAVGMIVLFGGFVPNNDSAPTEGYVSGAWKIIEGNQETTHPYPPDPAGASMAYDANSGQFILFGGRDLNEVGPADLNTTWEFNWSGAPVTGSGFWMKVATPTAPSPRFDAALAFDGTDGVLVLFGGQTASGLLLSDTWTWNGTAWTNISTAVAGPGPRVGVGFAPAPEPGVASTGPLPLLLVGGNGTAGTTLGDSWYFGNLTFAVFPPRPAAPGVDVGVTERISVLAFGANSGAYSYSWKLPGGCSGGNTSLVTCLLTSPGKPSASVNVSDGASVAELVGPISWYVNATPTISALTIGPSPDAVGLPMYVNTTVKGGTPPFTYRFTGLPAGCKGADSSSFLCYPPTAGRFTINVNVTDADGEVASYSSYASVVPGNSVGSAPSDYTLGILAVLGLLALIGIVIWVARRRTRTRPPPEESPAAPAPSARVPNPQTPSPPPATGDR